MVGDARSDKLDDHDKLYIFYDCPTCTLLIAPKGNLNFVSHSCQKAPSFPAINERLCTLTLCNQSRRKSLKLNNYSPDLKNDIASHPAQRGCFG